MKKVFAFGLLLISLSSFKTQQGGMFARWDKKDLERANTGKDVDFLSDEEKKVIFFTNLARINPGLFSETVLDHFMDSTGYKNSVYVVSLKKALASAKPGQPLVVQKDLYEIAKSHAENMGKTGKKGHEDFEKRYKPVLKQYNKLVGENCSYGFDKGLRIVLQLLIDEGVGDSGHRKNILDPNFKNLGASIKPHRQYTWNCVMAFGG
ncbi:MAG TPA: CAP domain-containing protein [Bacteroidia bacterium]|jgi:hypothetical protein